MGHLTAKNIIFDAFQLPTLMPDYLEGSCSNKVRAYPEVANLSRCLLANEVFTFVVGDSSLTSLSKVHTIEIAVRLRHELRIYCIDTLTAVIYESGGDNSSKVSTNGIRLYPVRHFARVDVPGDIVACK